MSEIDATVGPKRRTQFVFLATITGATAATFVMAIMTEAVFNATMTAGNGRILAAAIANTTTG
jgi:hypothetical protein